MLIFVLPYSLRARGIFHERSQPCLSSYGAFPSLLLRHPPVRLGTSRHKTEFYRAASALTDDAVVLSPDFIAKLRAGSAFSWRTKSRASNLQGTGVVWTAVVFCDSKTTRSGSRRRYDSIYLCGLSGEATGTLVSRYGIPLIPFANELTRLLATRHSAFISCSI